MIVKMTKYTIIAMASGREEFLERLQELGLVDVTTTGWEPSDADREMMSLLERHGEAIEELRKMEAPEAGTKPFGSGAEAFEKYEAARREVATLEAEIAAAEKLATEARPWGEFDPRQLHALAARGLAIRYYTTPASDFDKRHGEWSQTCTVERVAEERGLAYFVAVAPSADDLTEIKAQEARLPAESASTVEKRLEKLRDEVRGWDKIFARAAATLPAIEADKEALEDRLRFSRAVQGGESAADGSLVVMEAWAREHQADRVDKMLEGRHDVVAIKEQPTPQDATPVELSNNRFASPFEFIGRMYALPKYGTMDLTRWFAPFYMLFFAFCLADAGYGLLLFLGGLFLALKTKGAMQSIGKLSMWCGGAAVVFGFLVGSLFGLDIKTWGLFAGRPLFFPQDDMFLFGLSIGLGVLQILFGMTLKVITTTRVFGIRHALSTIGWMITILTGVLMLAPGILGLTLAIPQVVFVAMLAIGLFMMLFLNSPGKNPLVNFGAGLWNLYNDVTGFMSDVLSYIRLFAIGLSGGVLAVVFNDLAMGMSGDIPGVKQLIMLIILLIGHGLNLFMSALSSMVHPMRLTFVEFYKNAGFEMTTREFDPLKRNRK